MLGLEVGDLSLSFLELQLTLLRLAVPVLGVLAATAVLAAIADVIRSIALEVTRSR